MHLIVGLGNPGPKYALTRHNIGFMVVDALADSWRASFREEHGALVARSGNVLLAKPQTFMNLSGGPVQALVSYYKIELEKMLVIHDEIDLPFSVLRFQVKRGHGGHNGIRDIHRVLGDSYARLRMGVGRPTIPQMDIADYVLQAFSKEEMPKLPDFLSTGADATMTFIEDGFAKAQNKFNT